MKWQFFQCIWDILAHAAKYYPKKIAVIDDGTSFTYQVIKNRVLALSCFLKQQGIKPGDRISILHINGIEYIDVYFATPALGAILVPLNYRLNPGQLATLLHHHQSQVIITSEAFYPLLQKTLPLLEHPTLKLILYIGKVKPNISSFPIISYEDVIHKTAFAAYKPFRNKAKDIAHIYYTSGTTGQPKGVMLSHHNVCQHAMGVINELKINSKDRWGHIAPMFHLADAWAVFAITMVGATHIMQGIFKPENTLALIANARITITNLVPTMLNLMLKSSVLNQFDYSSLRLVMSGGAPIAPATVKAIISVFRCDYIQTYGLTETSPYLTLSILPKKLKRLPYEKRLHWLCKTGRPFKLIQLKVVDKAGQEVSPDAKSVGEVIVKGPTVTCGYWHDPEATRLAFDEQGYFHTGDLAVVDQEGFINIVDRLKDVIISGGENVYTIEVASCLYEHPNVLEAAVFGVVDSIWGEIVTAAVVLKPGYQASEQELIDFCKSKLAHYQAPKRVYFLSELPKSGSGKIVTRELQARFADKAP
ncbi:long-chain-fatty-acid--CoA ligase [Legionella oakridgensis]|uniref:Acyl-CoA synthetase n=1 Tax=Legionella oakridgensis TaxID=29423 RepID=A0A0W0XJ88_9GAMM|nr:long-chain-fatty-acid--CoA ligase [Legionella oakridgensis]KTD44549.1 acyl-CoA synthetase [Legionella oakridgensis]STY21040.1 acyl-CoA synthetase [Legionella longbeachae]